MQWDYVIPAVTHPPPNCRNAEVPSVLEEVARREYKSFFSLQDSLDFLVESDNSPSTELLAEFLARPFGFFRSTLFHSTRRNELLSGITLIIQVDKNKIVTFQSDLRLVVLRSSAFRRTSRKHIIKK